MTSQPQLAAAPVDSCIWYPKLPAMHAVAASHAHYANKGSSSSSHKKKSRRSSPFKATSGTVRKTSSFVQSGGIWSAIEQTEFTVLDW